MSDVDRCPTVVRTGLLDRLDDRIRYFKTLIGVEMTRWLGDPTASVVFLVNGRMDRWMDEWLNGWMNGWLVGSLVGWLGGLQLRSL